MKAALQWQEAARDDLIDSAEYYFERSASAFNSFLAEINATLARISERPRSYPIIRANIHRIRVGDFPHSILYRENLFGVQIIAVAHGKRNPDYWLNRI